MNHRIPGKQPSGNSDLPLSLRCSVHFSVQVLHMMMGLERIERMRLFAAELTAPTSPAPRAGRLTGSSRAPARRSGEPAAAEETGFRQPSNVGSVGRQASGFA